MSKFNKFTAESKKSLIIAQDEAKANVSDIIKTSHILIGILGEGSSPAALLLKKFGVSLENIRRVLKSGLIPMDAEISDGKSELSIFSQEVIENSAKIAIDFSHSLVSTEHLLLAITRNEICEASIVLNSMRIKPGEIGQEIENMFQRINNTRKNAPFPSSMEALLSGLHGVLMGIGANQNFNDAHEHKGEFGGKMFPGGMQPGPPPKKNQSKTPALDYFTIDFVSEAKQGKMHPVIGRDKEISRLGNILSRKTKNNPVLVGEPGVGKTAIVEGLAQRIADEKVSGALFDKKVLSLSMASLVAGTKYRGEFEERFQRIIREIKENEDEIILFIDELHTVIGAGSAEGSLDAANMLKPELSRGKIQVIGATTTEEYKKHIERDKALERRFQMIIIEEPSVEDTVQMIKGAKKTFEDFHNLNISDKAVEAAVNLSKRYVFDRQLPDKAFDIMDEASAKKSSRFTGNIEKIRKCQIRLAKIVKNKEKAVSDQNYTKAAELREKEITINEEIGVLKKSKIPKGKRKTITEDDVSETISEITGVPIKKLAEKEIEKLKNLDLETKKKIVGQDEAVAAVSRAIRKSRVGISRPDRPIGSFIFLGPTGVGKTELVKVLAEEIYGDERSLIKIDMSEFSEKHTGSRLIGTTPGYVGYEEGGELTEKVRRKPYSIILLDEIEKAHPGIFNLLLQILEDGQLTDGKGRKVDFRNTIIVLTSNVGGQEFTQKAASIGFSLGEEKVRKIEGEFDSIKEKVVDELRENFKPELLNRLDHIVVFRPLKKEFIKEIVKMQFEELAIRLKEKKIDIKLDNKALDFLTKESYDPEFGARPVRRVLSEKIEDKITEGILEGKFKKGSEIKISMKGKKLSFLSK